MPKKTQTHKLESLLLCGRHSVSVFLKNNTYASLPYAKLWATLQGLVYLEKELEKKIPWAHIVLPQKLDQLTPRDSVHQGLVLEVAISRTQIEKPLKEALKSGKCIVALDQISDPRNVGAILRTCAVFGVRYILSTKDRAAPLSSALIKAASGALGQTFFVRVVNLARTLQLAKQHNFEIIGLSEGQNNFLNTYRFSQKTILVFGAEGSGLRTLTRATCDQLVTIAAPQHGHHAFSTLNVASAASITLYAWSLGQSQG